MFVGCASKEGSLGTASGYGKYVTLWPAGSTLVSLRPGKIAKKDLALSAVLTLHLGGYELRGLYSLEEYYARNLGAYHDALTVGPSHNYYERRAKASITKWVEYFCAGAADSFESVKRGAAEAASTGAHDRSLVLRRLDPRQRKALVLFKESDFITSSNVADLFSISERAARNLLTAWVADGFVAIAAQA